MLYIRKLKKSNDQLLVRAVRQDHLEIARPNVLPPEKGLRRSAYYFTTVHRSVQAAKSYYPCHGRLCTCFVHYCHSVRILGIAV